jgi:D-serine dehydratase
VTSAQPDRLTEESGGHYQDPDLTRWLPSTAQTGHNGSRDVLGGDVLFPVVVLKEGAITHNARVMAQYCSDNDVYLAPHCKTHMSAELARLQLAAGAWAVTVANVSQARVFRTAGASRILIANQVIDDQALRWIAAELSLDPELEIYCLVDSHAGVEIMDQVLQEACLRRPLAVLVELGFAGGRSGCRSAEEAVSVASAVNAKAHLHLAGVECYEGILGHTPDAVTLTQVDSLFTRLGGLAGDLARLGWLDSSEKIIISAGGSAFFDRAVDLLARDLEVGRPTRLVLRCGAYLSHDHGMYQKLSPFGTRLHDRPPLRAACELWACVNSRPEPNLAILGFGKRDCAFDVELPTPLSIHDRHGSRQARDMQVVELNDQHAYLRIRQNENIAVGDLVCLGMSHPCTIFDKWRDLPVVDDSYKIIRTIHTSF